MFAPLSFLYLELVFALYAFDTMGTSTQYGTVYLNGTSPNAVLVNMTTTAPPSYGWRAIVVQLPAMASMGERVNGIALVVSCADGSHAVTDFVCYGNAEDYDPKSPVPNLGLARGKLVSRTAMQFTVMHLRFSFESLSFNR